MSDQTHKLVIYWLDGFERSYEYDSFHEALDHMTHGISWRNPHIKSARIFEPNGEPCRYEDAQTLGFF